MLGRRFQRTTSMAQIGIHTTNPASAEQHPPSSEQPTISQWEILKQAEEMLMMMMAAAGNGSGQPDGSLPAVRMSGTGGGSGHEEAAALQQPELIPRVNFLDNCYFCKRRLKHERDIFIYRGDAAFCTEECRQRQILKDESRAIGAASNKKGGTTSETAVAA